MVGVDIDEDVLEQCRINTKELEIDDYDIELIHADVLTLPMIMRERYDTVVLNPPFGTKNNAGIDLAFLQSALTMSTGVVYSMHKTSTRDHILRKSKESWKVDAQVIAQMKFEILHQFRFHKKERVYIDVDLIRFEK